MATLRGGTKICDNPECGKDCTRLYGFQMLKNPKMMSDSRVVEEFDKVKEEFEQEEFVFCWSCTAKAFGAKTLAEKEAEIEKVEIPEPVDTIIDEKPEMLDEKLKKKQEQMANARAAKTKPKGQ